jgi:hypothetical protein
LRGVGFSGEDTEAAEDAGGGVFQHGTDLHHRGEHIHALHDSLVWHWKLFIYFSTHRFLAFKTFFFTP